MRLIVPVNEPEVGEENTSITCMVVDLGEVTERSAKRKFRKVLKEWGIPSHKHKLIMKEYF